MTFANLYEKPWMLGILVVAAVTACDDPVDPIALVQNELETPAGVELFSEPFLEVTAGFVAVDLGTLGGFGINQANAINNRGWIAGTGTLPSGATNGFIWTEGTGLFSVGTTGGTSSSLIDINYDGVSVGWSETASGAKEAIVRNPGSSPFGLGFFGGTESRATAISNNGQISGRFSPVFDPMNPQGPQAFTWTGAGGFSPVGTLGGGLMTVANGLNENGLVVGNSFTSNDPNVPFRAFLRSGGSIQDIGSLGPEFGEHNAFDINFQGIVVGAAIDTVTQFLVPFTWSQSSGFANLVDQGFPANWIGAAWRINSLGHIVMLVIDPTRGNIPAVWIPGEGIVELPTLGGPNGQALDINDRGEVVGWSMTASGEIHPTLWRVEVEPDEVTEDVLTATEDIEAITTDPDVNKELDKAINQLGKAFDELNTASPDTVKVLKSLKKAAKELQDAIDDGLDEGIGIGLMEALVQAGRDFLVESIDNAIARGGSVNSIAKAQVHLANGDAELAAGNHEQSLKQYQNGVKDAEKA